MTESPLRTDWIESVCEGNRPGPATLLAHLRSVHARHAGFTERCAGRCRDAAGRNSYAWLAEAVVTGRHRVLLDVGCGSGPLLALCQETLPRDMRLIGVDMSPDELILARQRLPRGRAQLVEAQAQALDFLADDSIDVALCHWALTLMDPVVPVLEEMARVLRPGGRFAALVDGPMQAAPGYVAVHDLIYRHVQAELPHYGTLDLGDPRVRDSRSLLALIGNVFTGAEVAVETGVVGMSGPPAALAEEAAGFFYAALALSPGSRQCMLTELTRLLAGSAAGETATFYMPVNRVIVDLPRR